MLGSSKRDATTTQHTDNRRTARTCSQEEQYRTVRVRAEIKQQLRASAPEQKQQLGHQHQEQEHQEQEHQKRGAGKTKECFYTKRSSPGPNLLDFPKLWD